MFHFAYDGPRLMAEGVDLEAIARQTSTPAFIYSRATIEHHYRVFDEAFAGHPHLICYSVKANSNRAVLNLLARLGAGADIVSGGELLRARAAGIPAERIVFSGVGKTREEMALALDAGIRAFNVESEPELFVLNEVAAAKQQIAPVSLRVNPDVDPKTHPYIATGFRDAKFGIPIDDAARLASEVLPRLTNLKLVGIDCHIGSQLSSIEPLLLALDSVLALADTLRERGFPLQEIDLGGGLGIPYKHEEGHAMPSPAEFGREVGRRMKGRSEELLLEPGRVIVGNAGLLLTRVLYVKTTPFKTFVIVDAAMNDLLRPSLYQAHHDIWPVLRRGGTPIPVDVVGPVCETGDCFARARGLEPVKPGDLLAVMSAGAYGFSMSSTYNSRPLSAEVIGESGQRFEVVRKRQLLETLALGETVPDWAQLDRDQGEVP